MLAWLNRLRSLLTFLDLLVGSWHVYELRGDVEADEESCSEVGRLRPTNVEKAS